ncbi:MAG: FAD-dependent oxidoreductase [Lachnospiraceae bacterium]
MAQVSLVINNRMIVAQEEKTILEAALDNGIYIPHLCSHENLHPNGGCRLCVVEQEGVEGLVTSCATKVREGMVIETKTDLAEKVRKLSIDFMFKTHPDECTGCPKYGKCQLQSMSQYVGDTGRDLRPTKIRVPADESNPLMLHEMYRCILCGRCVRACDDLRGVGALKYEKVDDRMQIVINGDSLKDADCRFCGACVEVCPTGSIRDKIGVLKEGVSREFALIPCKEGCPAHINVPKYIRFLANGKYSEAAAVVREKAPFPECLGYICTHNCELACKRNFLNEAVSIRNLKRFAAEHDDGSWKKNAFQKPSTGKKAAVIGAGPAGLTAAFYLAKLGHDVTIYEKYPQAGGQMRYGIPSYRLPREALDREIEEIKNAGVKIICGTQIENASDLKEQGFDVVFTAIGTNLGVRLPLEGNDLPGVYVNADFLKRVNLGEEVPVGDKVIVLGGGNVAVDCAGTALRLGAKEVHMACLETRENMTASEEEILWTLEEGIIIHNAKTFHAIVSENGKVTGLSISGVKNFYFENGKAVIEKEENSDEVMEADTIIFAVGQRPDITESFGLKLDRGRIAVNEKTMATSVDGIFAAGDGVTGTQSVIAAIAGARDAVKAMDLYLGGDGDFEEALSPDQYMDPDIGTEDGFADRERFDPSVMEADTRKACFDLMDFGFDEGKMKCEASRCLQCDLREKLAPQRFWSDYVYEEGELTE